MEGALSTNTHWNLAFGNQYAVCMTKKLCCLYKNIPPKPFCDSHGNLYSCLWGLLKRKLAWKQSGCKLNYSFMNYSPAFPTSADWIITSNEGIHRKIFSSDSARSIYICKILISSFIPSTKWIFVWVLFVKMTLCANTLQDFCYWWSMYTLHADSALLVLQKLYPKLFVFSMITDFIACGGYCAGNEIWNNMSCKSCHVYLALNFWL